MKFLKLFGKNVKIYRELNKLSQEELAEKIEVSTGTISRIEGGRQFVKHQTLEKLTDVLKVPAGRLFDQTIQATDSDNKIELMQYIQAMDECEIEYILEQVRIYGKLKRKLADN